MKMNAFLWITWAWASAQASGLKAQTHAMLFSEQYSVSYSVFPLYMRKNDGDSMEQSYAVFAVSVDMLSSLPEFTERTSIPARRPGTCRSWKSHGDICSPWVL
jgi:hypothetical protein